MFIYQKNKINDVTGQVEQSLNVTFEDNKPVETPDVVITKDGVIGIKSESNAYVATLPGATTVSSYSIDGEIISINIDGINIPTLPFKKTVGFNVVGEGFDKYLYYIKFDNGAYTYAELQDKTNTGIYLGYKGEYIFDIENKVIHTPSKDYNFTELSTDFTESINNKTFIGLSFNYEATDG